MDQPIAISFFTGIGGIDLAAHYAGFRVLVMVEIDPFCQQVLKARFPDAILFGDIREVTGEKIRQAMIERGYLPHGYVGPLASLVVGGPPCQAASLAGKRGGTSDERWLWPDYFRVVREIDPRWVLAENVSGLLSLGADDIPGGNLESFSGSWPKWGFVSDGVCTALTTWAPPMNGTGFGLWPTPNVPNGGRGITPGTELHGRTLITPSGRKEQLQLHHAVKWATPAAADSQGSHGGGQGRSLRTDIHNMKNASWPTPTSNCSTGAGDQGREGGLNLQTAVARWPTPNASDHKGAGNPDGRVRDGKERTAADDDLPTRVLRWATPAAQDGKNSTLPPSQSVRETLPGDVIRAGGQGQLNPDWVEQNIMCFPPGWTVVDGLPVRRKRSTTMKRQGSPAECQTGWRG